MDDVRRVEYGNPKDALLAINWRTVLVLHREIIVDRYCVVTCAVYSRALPY